MLMPEIERRLRGGFTVNGLTLPEEELLITHAGGVSAAQELVRRWKREGPVGTTGLLVSVETDLASRDLDYWGDTELPSDDNEDEEAMSFYGHIEDEE